MIIAGYEYRGAMPFKNVYLTGIVRDKQGRKMSKSLGNSPDPLDLIATFGADAVRTGMLFSSPAGNDLPYDEKLVEQGRNFTNKIWNAFRFVKGLTVVDIAAPEENIVATAWFESRLQQSLTELNDHFSKFRISDALMTAYKLTWDDFCAWYLEIIKPEFGKPIDAATYDKTVAFFETLLKVLHPFMPFITEELWHELQERTGNTCVMVAEWPMPKAFDEMVLQEATLAFEIISEIRNTRNSKGLSPKEALPLLVKNGATVPVHSFWPVVKKLSNLSEITFVTEAPAVQASPFLVRSTEFFIPLQGKVDPVKEREELQKNLIYEQGFLAKVMQKLSNEKFVAGAPKAVLDMEYKKKADTEANIKALEEALSR
jgi:valyl-tRNA synthetase